MKKVIAFVLLLSGFCLGQVIDGSQTPAQIPDSVAYRMLFIALSQNPRLGPHLQNQLSLTQGDKLAIQNALSTFSSDYQSQVVDAYTTNPSTAIAQRESMVSSVRSNLSSTMSSSGFTALDGYVQNVVKAHTTLDTGTGLTFSGFVSGGSDCDAGCWGGDSIDIGTYDDSTYYLDGAGPVCRAIQTTTVSFNGGNVWQSFGISPPALTQFSSSLFGTVYGVTSTSKVYAYNNVTQGFDLIPGTMTQVSVGNGPLIYGVNASAQVFKYDPVAKVWNQQPGALTQVSVSPDGSTVWGVNSTHSIFQWNGSSWVQITGSAAFVSAADSSNVAIVGTDGKIYYYNFFSHAWVNYYASAPVFTRIAFQGNNGFYGVTSGNAIYKCTGGVCSQITGKSAKDVTYTSIQDVLTLDTSGHTQRFLPTSSAGFTTAVGNGNYTNVAYGLTVANLNAGQQFTQTSNTTTLANACGYIFKALISDYVQWAYTRSQNLEFGQPGEFCHYEGTVFMCDWNIIEWCTAATNPPDFNPTVFEGQAGEGTGYKYMDGKAFCLRLDTSHPWTCFSIPYSVVGFPTTMPPAACTKNP